MAGGRPPYPMNVHVPCAEGNVAGIGMQLAAGARGRMSAAGGWLLGFITR